VARWTAGAKWGEAPALDGWRAKPLGVRLTDGLGGTKLSPKTVPPELPKKKYCTECRNGTRLNQAAGVFDSPHKRSMPESRTLKRDKPTCKDRQWRAAPRSTGAQHLATQRGGVPCSMTISARKVLN
jgi:hypothetical protein